MKTVLIAIAIALLAAHSAVAQQAPRTPGPTNPNPTEQTSVDGVKAGSRGLTGNDEIPPSTIVDPASPTGQQVEPDLKPTPARKIK
jgi:hypothetical protein